MVKKKIKEQDMHNLHCGKNWMIFKGILSLSLGFSLWMMYLGLEQVIAIILVLVGLKKLYHSCC